MTKMSRYLAATLIFITVLYLVLLYPGAEPRIEYPAPIQPFAWNQDRQWGDLEHRFIEARQAGCTNLWSAVGQNLRIGFALSDTLSTAAIVPGSPLLSQIEDNLFGLAVMIAACPESLGRFQEYVVRLRESIKDQSIEWDMSREPAQKSTYRLLYGTRGALEEIMLQAPPGLLSPLLICCDEPSQTPATNILGATIHSGDILISRGGAATSALIARGNNYQGNFSHAALVYIDSQTNEASIIESHIERGVTISSLADYLNDKKLRVMVLRLRHDLEAVRADPQLPHKAARDAYEEARRRHIPYDFAMDTRDNSRKFCSEVVSDPYRKFGIKLWTKISYLTSSGIVSWLSDFGVRHFDTEAPSDLEYDPQLRVVAEWRDIETLYKDHVDNAVIDAMLEDAERGERLDYQHYMLPLARVAKAYSFILNKFGLVGPVPEGMDAVAALKNKRFTARHNAIRIRTLELAHGFQRINGYRPPYWEILKLARRAKTEIAEFR